MRVVLHCSGHFTNILDLGASQVCSTSLYHEQSVPGLPDRAPANSDMLETPCRTVKAEVDQPT